MTREKGTEIQRRDQRPREGVEGTVSDSGGTECQKRGKIESQKERNGDSTCGRDRHPEKEALPILFPS